MYYELAGSSGTKTIYVQVRNSQRVTSPVKSDSIEMKLGPEIQSFSIENVAQSGWGNEYRWKLRSKLEVTGNPTSIRYGENQDLSDGYWRRYRAGSELFYLYAKREGVGNRTMYIQVKNEEEESKIATAIFTIPARREFIIAASTARRKSEPYGFIFASTKGDITSQCDIKWKGLHDITLKSLPGPTGSRCDFTLFGGRQLNPGWVFKSYEGNSARCSRDGAGYRVDQRPQAGSRNITFKIHIWVDPLKQCWYVLKTLTLEGPGDAIIDDAFR
jgi:hypothetical protein